jgi:two-component system, OmpR family, sensor kinase
MTIRLRLMLNYSGLLAVILLCLGTAIYVMLRWTMFNQIDSNLYRIVNEVLSETGGTIEQGPQGQPQLTAYVPRLDTFRAPGVYVQIWEVYAGEELFSASENLGAYRDPLDNGSLGHNEEVWSTVTVNGTHLRVITKPIMVEGRVVGSVQAAASLTSIEAAMDRLLKIMLGGGAIALLTSLLVGDWLARRVLRPVGAIVSAAQSITAADDLERRIPYEGKQMDELGLMVAAFNETLERLERLFTSQRRFVGDVSHELRTPLTAIQGNLDLIRLYGNDPKMIETIDGEVKRMTRLVGDLLLLAQADSGQSTFQNEHIEIDRLLLDVYNEALLISGGKHTVKLGQFDQAAILGSSDRLKQLFLNLITNAIKYTPTGGQITLSIVRKQDRVNILLADTGMGIPPEDIPFIFDRFYRVDKARSRAAGGTGLGLSIVKWIVDVHHGTIQVKSVVDRGTTFTVSLPLAPEAQDLLASTIDTRPRLPIIRRPEV